jgi:predicted metal-dependent enzyme (double-stranded beta helix superfamily)
MSSLALAGFVRDAERLINEPHAIAERLKMLLAADGWLAPEHQRASGDSYRQHLLHVSDCRRLSVVALVWLPGQQTPIHDHVSWCVVGVYRGLERETHYRLVERDGERCLVRVGAVEARAGHVEALVPPAENIHSVAAAGPDKTISIHVYGADIERLGSSILRRYDDLRHVAGGRCRSGSPRTVAAALRAKR